MFDHTVHGSLKHISKKNVMDMKVENRRKRDTYLPKAAQDRLTQYPLSIRDQIP